MHFPLSLWVTWSLRYLKLLLCLSTSFQPVPQKSCWNNSEDALKFFRQTIGKKQQALLGPRLLLAVHEWRSSLTACSCTGGFSCSRLGSALSLAAAEPQRPGLPAGGEVWQFRRVSSGPWPATALLEDQDGVHPCAERATLSLCVWKVKGRCGSSLSLFYRARWVPVW